MPDRRSATASAGPVSAARVPLSRERVIRAAVELADAEGIESLTMRRLGQALGFEAMTLYYHVRNKDDLLGAIADLVTSEISVPPPDTPWRDAIRTIALSARATYRRHPWAAALSLSPNVGPAPARLGYMEALLGSLRRGGFSPWTTHLAYHAIESHIVGFTLWAAGISAGMASMPGTVEAFLRSLQVERYPYLGEHAEQHRAAASRSGPDEFEFGLELLLDGLERVRDPAG